MQEILVWYLVYSKRGPSEEIVSDLSICTTGGPLHHATEVVLLIQSFNSISITWQRKRRLALGQRINYNSYNKIKSIPFHHLCFIIFYVVSRPDFSAAGNTVNVFE